MTAALARLNLPRAPRTSTKWPPRVLAARPGVAHRRRHLGHVRARRRGGDRPARRRRRRRFAAASGAGGGGAGVEDGGEPRGGERGGVAAVVAAAKGLTWVCCDDDELPRFFLEALVKKAEGASDSLVVGGKYGEFEALPATIARLASEHGDEGVVVVLDEHRAVGHPRIKGSEMCKQLRDVHNFGGVVVIYSANDEDESKGATAPPASTASSARATRSSDAPDGLSQRPTSVASEASRAVTRRRLLASGRGRSSRSLTPDGERYAWRHAHMQFSSFCVLRT